jgi:hypothetical protein
MESRLEFSALVRLHHLDAKRQALEDVIGAPCPRIVQASSGINTTP